MRSPLKSPATRSKAVVARVVDLIRAESAEQQSMAEGRRTSTHSPSQALAKSPVDNLLQSQALYMQSETPNFSNLASWIPEGMDPTKAFKVTIKMGSYMAKDDSGRIEYITARSIQLAAINSDAELIEAFEMYFVERAIQLNMFVQEIGPKWSGKLMLGMTMEAVMMSQNTSSAQNFSQPSSVVEQRTPQLSIIPVPPAAPNLSITPAAAAAPNLSITPAAAAAPNLSITPAAAPNLSDPSAAQNKEDASPNKEVELVLPSVAVTADDYVGVDDEGIYGVAPMVGPIPEVEIGEDPTEHLLEREDEITDSVPSLRHFAILKQFEFGVDYSDKTKFGASCCDPDCKWRIHASRLQDEHSFQIKTVGSDHECTSTSFSSDKMASSKWVALNVMDWLVENPTLGPKELKRRIKEKYQVDVSYFKVWAGKEACLEQIQGSWVESFDRLFNFKAEVEKRCPGSLVEIDYKENKGKHQFSKLFVALKPCIDGFLQGCRPYLGIDSTFLIGKYRGQLAAATAIDGHNWMFPVAYGIFESEAAENWVWFLQKLKQAIGTPRGLALHTDVGIGLTKAVGIVFPKGVEHRECMMHMWKNMMKKFHGTAIDDNIWPAARAYDTIFYDKYMGKIKAGLPVDELADKLRQMMMEKIEVRRSVAAKFEGTIIPSVIKELNAITRDLKGYIVKLSSSTEAEVSGSYKDGTAWRESVDLEANECSCNQWQISGKPCTHALAVICSKRDKVEKYVNKYYSVQMFKAAYSHAIRQCQAKNLKYN
ncbi:uncharacterized protein LOC127779320 [Oryza glaberrima]|uniref:uncharacterized protein LOC127779320 n=1 Tax=Oryza glaberrima TaxID=4538 RepID=UPI00224C2FE3|nr:uncharacterized protein LOC127779320 [Oryza glaberrima]